MISSWAAWILSAGVTIVLGVGLYLLAWHRGYLAGRSNYIGSLPGDAWKPPTEAEFLAELIEAERKKPEPPRKYQREK
jgi:hypothetical protein